MGKGVKKTYDDWVAEIKSVHGDLFECGEIFRKNNRTLITFKCTKHNKEFTQRIDNLVGGKDYCCIDCGKEAKSKKLRSIAKDFFKNAKKVHGDKYDYSLIPEDFVGRDRIDIICKDHGVFNQTVRCHLIGNKCPKCHHKKRVDKKKKKSSYWINRAKKIHGEKYEYPIMPEYIFSKDKYKIKCTDCGFSFKNSMNNHVLVGIGCRKCGVEKAVKSKMISKEDYIKKAISIHSNHYDYSKLPNKFHATKKITIGCPHCGDFEQSGSNHLRGCKCNICHSYTGIRPCGWSRETFIRNNEGLLPTFYVLACFNNEELFFKIGITKNKISERYSTKKSLPYNYEVVLTVNDTPDKIYDLEKKYKNGLVKYKHEPKIHFEGCVTECFSKLSIPC